MTKVLALGGDLKTALCLGKDREAWLSEPGGDLGEAGNYRSFISTANRIARNAESEGIVIAHDLHPGYSSTAFARRLPHRRIGVQHHHAHAISCALDAELALPVIGIVCDGTGYGSDGAIWGGEVLYCTADSFRRAAYLDYFQLPGGDAAARDTWRPALSVVREALSNEWGGEASKRFAAVNAELRKAATAQIIGNLNAPFTSSLGRLFDAVAFLTGVCSRNESEGQAAIELERAAGDIVDEAYPSSYPNGDGVERGRAGERGPLGRDCGRNRRGAASPELAATNGPMRLDWRPMIRGILDDLSSGRAVPIIAARFHATIIRMLSDAAIRAIQTFDTDRVVLSGGCFLNRRLREGLVGELTDYGLQVGVHQRVSPGDAGLSLGQAFVGATVASLQTPGRQGA